VASNLAVLDLLLAVTCPQGNMDSQVGFLLLDLAHLDTEAPAMVLEVVALLVVAPPLVNLAAGVSTLEEHLPPVVEMVVGEAEDSTPDHLGIREAHPTKLGSPSQMALPTRPSTKLSITSSGKIIPTHT
jgi:hypothetical protein